MMPGAHSTLFAETTEAIREALTASGAIPTASGVSVSSNGGSLTVTYTGQDGTKTVAFDLSVPEEFALFAELHYALTLPSVLSHPELLPLVQDSIPDLYSVSFSSLTGLIEKYGRESPQFIAAVKLVDASLPQVVDRFAALYPESLAAEIVLLGSHPTMLASTDMREVIAQLQRALPTQEGVAEYLPYVYLPQSNTHLSRICEVLNLQLSSTGFSAYCPQVAPTFTQFAETNDYDIDLQTINGNVLVNYTKPDQRTIEDWQIFLWVSIILFVLLITIVYSTMYMDIRKDSILYGNFNPNWEDRKKAR